MSQTRCQCGAVLPRIDATTTHRYIVSTPECWERYGRILAREYSSAGIFAEVHHLTVDAYAAQHPAHQPATSLATHLVALRAAIELGSSQSETTRLRRAFVESNPACIGLEPPPDLGPLTVADVAAEAPAEEYARSVRRWALGVWEAWAAQRAAIAALHSM